MKKSIITTTINTPHLIDAYAQDAAQFNHEFNIIISGDKKTPTEAKDFCKKVASRHNIDLEYMDVEDQETFMKDFPELNKFLPWNSIQRRNLPIMKAYLEGSELIITIDDDNFLVQENYLELHGPLGVESNFKVLTSPTGWLNICEYLEDKHGREFYPRGHPWLERISPVNKITESNTKGKIVVNGGFWLGDPDIDAVTRLANPIEVISYKRQDNFSLDINTWAPFNSQNTALHRSVIPCYFLAPGIGRFDDIWASYIVKRVADHLGDYISFGFPLVKQKRNEHDLWVDASHERLGTQLSDQFCKWLREIDLTTDNYLDSGIELINGLSKKVESAKINQEQKDFLEHFINGYRIWFKTIKRINEMSLNEQKY